MNANELIDQVHGQLNFIIGNPDVAHDLRVEAAERAKSFLEQLRLLIPSEP